MELALLAAIIWAVGVAVALYLMRMDHLLWPQDWLAVTILAIAWPLVGLLAIGEWLVSGER